jgi:hypothetical protein
VFGTQVSQTNRVQADGASVRDGNILECAAILNHGVPPGESNGLTNDCLVLVQKENERLFEA